MDKKYPFVSLWIIDTIELFFDGELELELELEFDVEVNRLEK
jgi:hypothetical protein